MKEEKRRETEQNTWRDDADERWTRKRRGTGMMMSKEEEGGKEKKTAAIEWIGKELGFLKLRVKRSDPTLFEPKPNKPAAPPALNRTRPHYLTRDRGRSSRFTILRRTGTTGSGHAGFSASLHHRGRAGCYWQHRYIIPDVSLLKSISFVI